LLTGFPAEILLKILKFADVTSLLHLRMVSKFLKQISEDNNVWKYHCIKDWGIVDTSTVIDWQAEYIDEYKGSSFNSCSNFIKQKFLGSDKAESKRSDVPVYFVNLMDNESTIQVFSSIFTNYLSNCTAKSSVPTNE